MSEARKGPQEAGDLNLRLLTRIPTQMAALLCFVDFCPNFLPFLVKAERGVGWGGCLFKAFPTWKLPISGDPLCRSHLGEPGL